MVRSFESVEVNPRKRGSREPAQQFLIERDGEPDLRFKGWLVASAKTKPARAVAPVIRESTREGLLRATMGDGSRWFEYRIYLAGDTQRGSPFQKLVAEKIGCSDIPSEKQRRQVFICETGAALVRTLGADEEWKDLYRKAGIDTAEDLT